MKKEYIIAAVALVFGVSGGYGVAQLTHSHDDETHEHSSEDVTDSHSHASMLYSVDAEDAPTVDVMVAKDAKSGFNVHVMTNNFRFAPENVNGENVLGEGHAHLYVDGVKISRLYGNYFHYDAEFEGEKTFKVTLNANDHSEYAVDGEPISAEKVVTNIPYGDDALGDDHDH